MNCAKCGQEMLGYFKVERVNRNGQAEIGTAVCSIPCLIGWGTEYAQMAGMRLAFGVKQKIDNARSAWQTLKQMISGS